MITCYLIPLKRSEKDYEDAKGFVKLSLMIGGK